VIPVTPTTTHEKQAHNRGESLKGKGTEHDELSKKEQQGCQPAAARQDGATTNNAVLQACNL
jgi:hypothetical protein